MAEEEEVIEEKLKVEEGDECHCTDPKDRLFVLLLRVSQANGRPLPIGGFASRAMTQMIYDMMGVIPREVVVLTNQEVVFLRNRGSILYNGSVKSDTRVVSLGRSINHGR